MSPQEPEPLPLPAPASSGAELSQGGLGVQRGPPSPVLGPPGCSSHGKSHRPQLGNPVLSVRCWIPPGGSGSSPLPGKSLGCGDRAGQGHSRGDAGLLPPPQVTAPQLSPPFPWGQASPTPPDCARELGVPVPTAATTSLYRAQERSAGGAPAHRGTTWPPIPQAPPAPTAFLPGTPGASPPQEPTGPGEAGPRGWDGDVCPQGHPHPVTFLGAGESRGEKQTYSCRWGN